MLTHSGQKPYKCPHCPIRFTTKSNCERHLIRKHEKSSSSAIGRSSLKWNLPQEKAASRMNCVCCSRSFANEASLKDHQSHQPEKPFRCVMCCQQFAKATECAQHAESEHALRVTPENSDNYCSQVEGQVCFVCYQRVEDAIALRMHFRTSHGLDGNNNTKNSSANSPLSTLTPKSGTKSTIAADNNKDTRTDEIRTENRRIAVSAS